ncbi:MAG: hypothetical protein ACXV98_04185 [Ilumatobacteraceae bacterium]
MMKTKVAMAISLAGVLAAGTAAALVNTHVLNGGASAPLALSAPQSQQIAPAQAVSPPAAGSTAPVPAAANPPAAASPTQATYAIGDSGTVTLDTAGDVLTIVAVTPAANWTVVQSETSDASNGEVKFQSGNTEVEFQANLLYGVVRTSVETHDLSATNNTVGASGGGDDSGQGDGLQGSDDGGGGDD